MVSESSDNQAQWYSGECCDPYRLICIQWTVPIRYQSLTYVGRGEFGAVMQAMDTKTNQTVAIKKLFDPFICAVQARQTYRELRLLEHVNHRDAQIVQLYNVFTPDKTLNEFNTLYFVFNFVDFDLNRVISNRNQFTDDHIQQIIYSILRGLKFLHSAKIIHRDITTKNIGISQDSDVTILDLGLSRVASDGLQTRNVVAQWFRAPEVMINWEEYDSKLDIWSVGCIMAEMIRLTPLFPGLNSKDQLEKIISILGKPTEDELKDISKEDPRLFILNEVPNADAVDFHELFPDLSEDGIDFIQSLLRFDPRQRPTAEQALEHPYLTHYHDAEEEPTAPPIAGLHDNDDYTVEQWKRMTWESIQSFREPAWALESLFMVTS